MQLVNSTFLVKIQVIPIFYEHETKKNRKMAKTCAFRSPISIANQGWHGKILANQSKVGQKIAHLLYVGHGCV